MQVQHYPIYYLVKAQCERKSGEVQAALASLQTAMNFITRKSSGSKGQSLSAVKTFVPWSINFILLQAPSIRCRPCFHL